jgi:hypothetical protein
MKVKRVDPLQKPKVETADAIANDAHWPPGGMSSIRHTANDVATPKLWLKTQRVTRLVIGVIGSLFLNIAQIWLIFTGHGPLVGWVCPMSAQTLAFPKGLALGDARSVPGISVSRHQKRVGQCLSSLQMAMLMRKISAMVLINIDKILINQWMELMEWCILSAPELQTNYPKKPFERGWSLAATSGAETASKPAM